MERSKEKMRIKGRSVCGEEKRKIQINPSNMRPPKIKDFESEKHKHIEVENVKVIIAIVIF